ncbi:hypothetical protein [Marinilabilia sp.]|jgi:predicted nucleic acid-binding Zn ribbon protein|uniref:hypothetical protein n=1 Tax=Marinilabilia sp. TaxID=2021252 RepID=UPI0025C54AEA|nr:hypothetical protein [Marinilabilia sp.]
MKKKKLSKQQLREKQRNEEKKFNRTMIISFILLSIMAVLILVFFTYRCQTRFFYRETAWYGKEIPGEWVCMDGDILKLHKTSKSTYKNNVYYFCSEECYNYMVMHFTKTAMVRDAISGDLINKAEALIGLKEKGKPELVYFKNRQTMNMYYEQRKK